MALLITDAQGREKLYTVRPVPHNPLLCGGAWEMENLNDGRVYDVAESYEHGWICTCKGWPCTRLLPDGTRKGCKHVRAFRAARLALVCGRPIGRPGEEWGPGQL